MHVPTCASQELTLMGFKEALALADATDLSAYDHSRWLYVPNRYCDYRYLLGTRGRAPLICIGINPSTAAPDALDNTLKSVSRIAAHNGFDSWMMFNVYAQRATDPNDMDAERNDRLHAENMKAFAYLLDGCGEGTPPTVWAAWGTLIEKRPYLVSCVEEMIALGKSRGARWVCAGKRSVKGHPHHPLYLRKDETIRPFDVEAYCAALHT